MPYDFSDPNSAVSGWGDPPRSGGFRRPRRRPVAPRTRGARGRDEPLPAPASKHSPHGDDMLTVDHTLPALVAELQARLDDGALTGFGPVTLASGPIHDAELAGR